MVTCSGSLATISCELRQVRKEATVAVISGAEVRLGQVTTLIFISEHDQAKLNLAEHDQFFSDLSLSGAIPGCNLSAFFDRLYRCFYWSIFHTMRSSA